MVLSTEWSQLEVIDLVNDGNGLGFMLVGGRSTGVVIKALIPGGVAEKDGRLQSGDHVLQIGDVNLRGFSSDQVATVLRQTGSQVRLVVARPVEPTSPDYQTLATHAPIIATKLLSDPDEIERQLIQTIGYTNTYLATPNIHDNQMLCNPHVEIMAITDNENIIIPLISPTISLSPIMSDNCYIELPETETYDVDLRKNVYGLGITVAGYVCEEEDLSGIFVKSIIEGSAAEMSRMIQINDRIVAVDGISLTGVTNHRAVEILRNTDIAVKLTLERFLRGRRYEHLQVALTENKCDGPPLAASPSVTTLSWVAPKSEVDSVTTECGDCIIEPDFASQTTFDSSIFAVELGDDSAEEEDKNVTEKNDEVCEETKSIADTNDDLDSWTSAKPGSRIIVAEIKKTTGLGITLEGAVEVCGGIEMRPHHFIRSILGDGPVGRDGTLRPGDELLQVNEQTLEGLTHTSVVKILRELPNFVKVVCARGPKAPSVVNTSPNPEAFEARSILAGGLQSLQTVLTKAQSESSLYTSSSNTLTDHQLYIPQRSRSVEEVSGMALWTTEVIDIEIEKTSRGFGFSILDYQDPLNTDGIVIVIRSLIPGGSAEATNMIFPGDRLISVADHQLDGLPLDDAVVILKGMPNGLTSVGICRPLCISDESPDSTCTT